MEQDSRGKEGVVGQNAITAQAICSFRTFGGVCARVLEGCDDFSSHQGDLMLFGLSRVSPTRFGALDIISFIVSFFHVLLTFIWVFSSSLLSVLATEYMVADIMTVYL